MPKLNGLFGLRGVRVTAAAALVLASSPALAQDKPTVIAASYALSYFADRLTGEDADVVFPIPAGTDPSFWRPSIAAISEMQTSDLILLNGAGFSTWTTKASLPRSRIIETSRAFEENFITTQTITHSHGEGDEHSHKGIATYTWLDQELAMAQAEAIAGALEQRGLVDASALETRLAALKDDLNALDTAAENLRDLAQTTPIITTHPRYQYLARAYGLDVHTVEWEAGLAPDAAQLAELEKLVEATGARVLLWEAAPPENARTAVHDMGLADVVFPTLATVPPGADYLQSFGGSVEALQSALKSVGG